MSVVVSFCVILFVPRDVLDEILNLIESVSVGFPTYSYGSISMYYFTYLNVLLKNNVGLWNTVVLSYFLTMSVIQKISSRNLLSR